MEKDFKLVTICCSHTQACTEVVRCGGGASEDGVGVGLEGELALARVCVCVCALMFSLKHHNPFMDHSNFRGL